MAVAETVEGTRREASTAGAGSGARMLGWVLIVAGLAYFLARQLPGIGDAFRLALPDNDDMMRLLGVRDLLAGQSWLDTTQYRYLPPDGVLMHWSRLVDLPLALAMAGLRPLVGAEWAEKLTVAFWPLALFVVYAGIVARGVWRRLGPVAAGASIFVAGQMVVFSDIFAPGRIDHHNVQVILTVAAALCFVGAGRKPTLAGVLIGLSLAVGLETLPFVAMIAFAFAALWVVEGEGQAAVFARFGAALAVTVLVAFLAETAPSRWLTPACGALSTPWLLLTVGGGVAAIVLSGMTRLLGSWRLRVGAGALCGAILVGAFVLLFPVCLQGPYAAVPEPYRTIWLRGILEARPFLRFLEANPTAALSSVVPLAIAAIVTTIGAARAGGERGRALALLASLLWLGSMLAQVQVRTLYISAGFVPLAAAWLVSELVGTERRQLAPRARIMAAAGLVLMLEFPWTLAAEAAEPARTGRVEAIAATRPCSDPSYVSALGALPPGHVLAQGDLGPSILLQTRDTIIVAGFHRAPAGIVAGIEAFGGDEAAMKRVVERFGADIVAICPAWVQSAEPPPFAQKLVDGASVPWLQPVDLDAGPLKVWRVVKGR